MTPEEKEWIDSADYEALLRRWRFSPSGDSMFIGDTGQYYHKAMMRTREAIGSAEAAAISKRVGLERTTP